MRVVSITDVRQDATAIITHAQENEEPVLVVQRSRPAAYVVGAAQYEALTDELKRLRRAELLRDVAEAEAEIARGQAQEFSDASALIASWDTSPKRPRSARRAAVTK